MPVHRLVSEDIFYSVKDSFGKAQGTQVDGEVDFLLVRESLEHEEVLVASAGAEERVFYHISPRVP